MSDRAPRLQSTLKEYKLALNRAHHNAGNEVPLQQGIDQQRDNCNNDLGCIEVGVAQGGRIHHGRQIALLDQIFHVDLQTLDIGHQRIIGGFGHVDQATVEVVPAAHNAEQGYGGQNRLGNGDEDLGQNLERVGAVNEGGFLKLFGNGSKEVHHQDDIEDGHGSRQNQGPDGIEQAVGFDNQEGGDHAAVEKHGKNHQVCIDVAAPELCVGFGEGISHQYDQHKVDDQGQHNPLHRDQEGVPELGVLQDLLIGCGAESHRDQPYHVAFHCCRGEGDGNNVQQRQQTDYTQCGRRRQIACGTSPTWI